MRSDSKIRVEEEKHICALLYRSDRKEKIAGAERPTFIHDENLLNDGTIFK